MIPRLSPSFGPGALLAATRAACRKSAPDEFAAAWAERTGIPHVALFPLGRSAIRTFLRALEPDDARNEVILPAYTCVVVAEAIVTAGFVPVFVDCEPGTLEPSPQAMAGAAGPATRAVIATHIFGRRYPVARLRELLPPGVAILEDRAHDAAAGVDGRPHLLVGDAAFWSFNHGKPVSAVYGAAMASANGKLMDRVRAVSVSLRPRSLLDEAGFFAYAAASCMAFHPALFAVTRALTDPPGPFSALTRVYDPGQVRMPAAADRRISRLACGLALVQDDDAAFRVRAYEMYESALKGLADLQVPVLPPGSVPSHAIVLTKNRDRLRRSLRDRGIDTGVLFDYAVPDIPSFAPWRRAAVPNASQVAAMMLNLPMHHGMNDATVAAVADAARTAALELV